MNSRSVIAIALFLGASWATAQTVDPQPQEDPVVTAIREFNRQNSGKPNEVTVVLEPPTTDVTSSPAKAGSEAEAPTPKAVLVTGKPPESSTAVTAPPQETAPPPNSDPSLEEASPDHQKGLNVRVVTVQSGDQSIAPSDVKLLAPFPAKPLNQPPSGWRFETSEAAPPFTREVELAPGSKITLTVRPHILVPDTDGARTFNMPEPGFDNSLGYRQTETIGAILSNSLREMDEDSKKLGNAIDQLQQLLVSLPKPETEPATQPTPSR